MTHKPVFLGLIVDEKDRPVEVTYVGGEPYYVVDDDGFLPPHPFRAGGSSGFRGNPRDDHGA